MTPIFDANQFMTTLTTVVPLGVGFIWAIKSDTKVLKQRLDETDRQISSVDNKLNKIDELLIEMAKHNGRMDRIDDRLTATNARIDELSRRVNQWLDGQIQSVTK